MRECTGVMLVYIQRVFRDEKQGVDRKQSSRRGSAKVSASIENQQCVTMQHPLYCDS